MALIRAPRQFAPISTTALEMAHPESWSSECVASRVLGVPSHRPVCTALAWLIHLHRHGSQ